VVAEEEGALVADFAGDEAAGEAESEPGGLGEGELGFAEEDVLLVEAGGEAVEPAAGGEVADGDAGVAEGLDGLGGELDVAEEGELAEFVEADLLEEAVLGGGGGLGGFLDLEDVAGAADAEALGVEVEGAEVGAWGDEAADGAFGGGGFAGEAVWGEERELLAGIEGVAGAEEAGFVREADGGEGAAGALGGAVEGRGDDTGAGEGPGAGDGVEDFGGVAVVEGDADALAGLGVPEGAFFGAVAVFAENEALDAELDAVGGPGLEAGVGFQGTAAFVVDGHGEAFGQFDEVHFGDNAPAFGGEGD